MGSIYKLTDGDKCYYGSTTQPLRRRLVGHKNLQNHSTSKQLNKDNLTIELMEEVEDVEQLKCREAWFIANNECVNIKMPYRTKQDKSKLAYMREIRHYQNPLNKEKKRLYTARKGLCECGKTITLINKNRHVKSAIHIKLMSLKTI